VKTFVVSGALLLVLVSIIVLAIAEGLVLRTLWGWFVAPTFGLPLLQTPVALGIALMIRTITYENCQTNKADEDSPNWVRLGLVAVALLKPLIALFFGWIIYHFV